MTPKIEIYTTPFCPYCDRAKALLKQKGLAFKEIDVSADTQKREEMLERSGGARTVPQIFINDQSIGGSDDLYALDKEGKLDALIGAGQSSDR